MSPRLSTPSGPVDYGGRADQEKSSDTAGNCFGVTYGLFGSGVDQRFITFLARRKGYPIVSSPTSIIGQ
jgi:hypothetical protein